MAGPVLFHVDQPANWELASGCLIVRGWCFAADGRSVQAVRLGTATLRFDGVYGFPRPDVPPAVPAAPGPNTGFEIRGTLPPGRHRLVLEVQLSDGSFHRLAEPVARVARRWPLWLGGGDWSELMFFQMPSHARHPPRPIRPEHFGRLTSPPAGRPRVAIVTPSYQQGRFLPRTTESVLEQADAWIDYVVQDGGSTDGSVEWLRGAIPPLTAAGAVRAQWESAPDQGQADAILKGFAKTAGTPTDVMAWINSDDFYLPGAVGFVSDFFARNPDVDVVYGHRVLVDEDSAEIGRWFLPPHDPAVLRLNDFVPQETLFWRRRLWDRVGGIDPQFQFAMDWDLLLRFQDAGARIVRVPRFLACFRIHAAQKTTTQMHSVGQAEITRLRERTFSRPFPPQELETNPILLRYLRRSARIEFLDGLGLRSP